MQTSDSCQNREGPCLVNDVNAVSAAVVPIEVGGKAGVSALDGVETLAPDATIKLALFDSGKASTKRSVRISDITRIFPPRVPSDPDRGKKVGTSPPLAWQQEGTRSFRLLKTYEE